MAGQFNTIGRHQAFLALAFRAGFEAFAVQLGAGIAVMLEQRDEMCIRDRSMVVTAHGFAMPVKEAFAPLLKLRHCLNPVRLVPGWQSASAPALLRGIALVELAVLVVIVISRGRCV